MEQKTIFQINHNEILKECKEKGINNANKILRDILIRDCGAEEISIPNSLKKLIKLDNKVWNTSLGKQDNAQCRQYYKGENIAGMIHYGLQIQELRAIPEEHIDFSEDPRIDRNGFKCYDAKALLHKEHIIGLGVNQEIKKEIKPPRTGKIYIFEEGHTGKLKIGLSKNPDSRRKGLQTGNSKKLIIRATGISKTYNIDKAEKMIHNHFEKYKINEGGDEFFNPPISEVIDFSKTLDIILTLEEKQNEAINSRHESSTKGENTGSNGTESK